MLILKHVVDDRNYIAHDLLANDALVKAILEEAVDYTKEARILNKAVFELEQVCFLFDWNQENDGWH